MQTLGLRLLAGLCATKNNLEQFLHLNLKPELFQGSEIPVYEHVMDYVQNYGKLPTVETVAKHTNIMLEPPDETPAYYYDELINRYLQQGLTGLVADVHHQLKAKQPRQALEDITQAMGRLALETNKSSLIDFTKEGGMIVKGEYEAQQQLGEGYGIRTGWSPLDNLIGHLAGGDILTLVGRPATGKTYQLLNMAHHVWQVQHKVPLFVSMEMKPLLIMQRLAAMHTRTPIDWIHNTELPTMPVNKKAQVFDGLADLSKENRPFWLVDGNLAATPQEINLLAQQLKPDVVFIDGAYLVSMPYRMSSQWEKIKAVIEYLKQHTCTALNIPLISSYQLNREIEKAKDPLEEMGLEHIAGGDDIGKVSSIVLGVFQNSEIEGLKYKHIKILKSRSGERGSFKIHWKFHEYPYMDFSAVPITEEEKDLEYVT